MSDKPEGPSDGHQRDTPVRSFVRRTGRITPAQSGALTRLLGTYGLNGAEPLDLDRVFGRSAPRWLEIGFGDGEALLLAAAGRPDVDHLGVEVHDPGVGRVLLGIESGGLRNLRVVHGDAQALLRQGLMPGCLERVALYFPDPWPKKRHHKRRIVQPDFVALVASRLVPDGRLHMATDWQPYAEVMLEVLEAEPALSNSAGPGRFSPTAAPRPATRFERRGRRLGHGVWDLVFTRRP